MSSPKKKIEKIEDRWEELKEKTPYQGNYGARFGSVKLPINLGFLSSLKEMIKDGTLSSTTIALFSDTKGHLTAEIFNKGEEHRLDLSLDLEDHDEIHCHIYWFHTEQDEFATVDSFEEMKNWTRKVLEEESG